MAARWEWGTVTSGSSGDDIHLSQAVAVTVNSCPATTAYSCTALPERLCLHRVRLLRLYRVSRLGLSARLPGRLQWVASSAAGARYLFQDVFAPPSLSMSDRPTTPRSEHEAVAVLECRLSWIAQRSRPQRAPRDERPPGGTPGKADAPGPADILGE